MIRQLNTGLAGHWIGDLPEGCKMCIYGQKAVIFVTGICNKPKDCNWYCPISNERKDKDVIYVNERKVNNIKEIIEECLISNARGASITGGEPLLRLKRVIEIIDMLKKAFGKAFHIHLYTNGLFATKSTIERLYRSGLDEIRFHILTENTLNVMRYAKKLGLKVGMEIPVIPGKSEEIKEIIQILDREHFDFINLNEFEITESNYESVTSRGYMPDRDKLFAVKGSFNTALEILKWSRKNIKTLNVHFCPIWVKDSVQLRNRFKNRARNVAKPYEKINEDGLLERVIIYLKDNSRINKIKEALIEKIPEKKVFVNFEKNEIYLHPDYVTSSIFDSLITEYGDSIKKIEITEETPTYERVLMTATPLWTKKDK